MKLLLDENLSDRIVSQISDLFPASLHVKEAGLFRAEDSVIAEWATLNGFSLSYRRTATFTDEASCSGSLRNHLVAHRQLLHRASRGFTQETAESDSRVSREIGGKCPRVGDSVNCLTNDNHSPPPPLPSTPKAFASKLSTLLSTSHLLRRLHRLRCLPRRRLVTCRFPLLVYNLDLLLGHFFELLAKHILTSGI